MRSWCVCCRGRSWALPSPTFHQVFTDISHKHPLPLPPPPPSLLSLHPPPHPARPGRPTSEIAVSDIPSACVTADLPSPSSYNYLFEIPLMGAITICVWNYEAVRWVPEGEYVRRGIPPEKAHCMDYIFREGL